MACFSYCSARLGRAFLCRVAVVASLRRVGETRHLSADAKPCSSRVFHKCCWKHSCIGERQRRRCRRAAEFLDVRANSNGRWPSSTRQTPASRNALCFSIASSGASIVDGSASNVPIRRQLHRHQTQPNRHRCQPRAARGISQESCRSWHRKRLRPRQRPTG